MVENKESFYKKLWQNRFIRFGLGFILLVCLLAVFAYMFIPDNSPNANRQFVELSLKKAGFEAQLLKLPKTNKIERKGKLNEFFFGKEEEYNLKAFEEIRLLDHTVEITNYIGRKQLIPFSALSLANKTTLAELKKQHVVSRSYPMGTDRYGRCIFSRLVLGIRISLLVGFIAVLISTSIGIVLGSIAGYFGGKIDQFIVLLINIMWSIPTLLLVFAIVLALGRGIGIIFLAVGLTMWVEVARIVRGQVIDIKENQYITAAESMGFSHTRIISKHILPNIIGPILVVAAANFATAILIEAGLSYLGFGIKPPTPSIGTMLNENYGFALSGRPMLAIIPSITIMLLVLSFNLVGTGMRDIFDIKTKSIHE